MSPYTKNSRGAFALRLFFCAWAGGLEEATVQSELPVDVRDRGRPSRAVRGASQVLLPGADRTLTFGSPIIKRSTSASSLASARAQMALRAFCLGKTECGAPPILGGSHKSTARKYSLPFAVLFAIFVPPFIYRYLHLLTWQYTASGMRPRG